jgi:4'-phosphopantetheinyl transferase
VERTLDPGEVHVWYEITEASGDLEIEEALAILSPNERARQSRFMFARDRRDYAVAHGLLRRSLSRYADVPPESWRFCERPGGKPALVGDHGMPWLSFNLSHTHGLVACAIARGSEVGVDVESARRAVDAGVANAFFSEVENADLRRCASPVARATRFCQLWTLKEAYIKAIGKGLSHPLNTIVFGFRDDESIIFTPPADVDAKAWQFALFAPTEKDWLAVAVRRDRDTPSSIRLMTRADKGADIEAFGERR